MKAILISVWALVGCALGGQLSTTRTISWPGAVVSTSQSVTKGRPSRSLGFQYIQTIPSAYPVALQPQVSYQIPQLTQFAPVQQEFYPIPSAPYFPGTILYPTLGGFPPAAPPLIPSYPGYYPQPIAPVAPSQPAQDPPSYGDADTSVVDSADYPQQQEQQSPSTTEAPKQEGTTPPQQDTSSTSQPQQDSQPQPQPQPPSSGLPSFPSFPQIPGQEPSFPSFPQFPQGSAEFPSFPSIQYPQGQLPAFPQFPQFPPNSPSFPQAPFPTNPPSLPQAPSPSPPSSYPGQANDDKGLNDEDTISIESA